MRSRKAPGLSKVTVDHIKTWYKAAYPEKGDGDENALHLWEIVADIVQQCFATGDVPRSFYFGVLVIIPKDDVGGVRGIGLLEVIHKVVSQIINLRMATAITFLEDVHGFRRKRGTYTAIGEAKVRMQMAIGESKTIYQIYLDLRKAYDSIDRNRVLLLLEKYGVGIRIRRYVAKIWNDQQFILRQGGFYSETFNVDRGCTQGDIDSPIIFNIIIDAVLRAWRADPRYNKSRSYFYADDGLLENEQHKELQEDLDTIIGLFGQMGLKANEKKTKYMVIRGAAAPTALSDEVYNNIDARRRGERTTTYQSRRRLLQVCGKCGVQLQATSLRRHMQRQHNEDNTKYLCQPAQPHRQYSIECIIKGKFNYCPVDGCTGGGKDRSTSYRHFCYRHPNDDIIIQEDGILDKCSECGMRCLNLQRHRGSQTCKKAAQRRHHEQLQRAQFDAESVTFTVNGKQIERVREFRYLGRIITDNDDDTRCIKDNIKRAKKRWNCIAKILKREGANAVCMSRFYLTIVQAVLLYGAESWAIFQRNMDLLKSFHWRSIRYMTGVHIAKQRDGAWFIPDHEELLRKCRLFPIETYIERRRGTLRMYMEDYRAELLMEADRGRGHCRDPHKIYWWNQRWIQKEEMANLSKLWFPD